MNESKSFREASRINWTSGAYSQPDNIKLGCLLRIADATEKMALHYSSLIEERDRYKKWYEKEKIQVSHLQSVISGLRGTITKMKKGKK